MYKVIRIFFKIILVRLNGFEKYAFFIYLFHLCVADILKDVAVAAGIEKNLLYLWMRPVMVCVLVTAVAVMYGYGMRICRK